jgi:hypothetical protein
VAVFRVANEVEKALGVRATLRVERIAVRVRNDMLILIFGYSVMPIEI